jgi:predicted alpha/beta-fold hydrolase
MLVDLPPFRPHRLVRGGHLQTIAGCYWPSPSGERGTEHRVPLPDGDAIVLHDDGPEGAQVAALLVHGLGGCGRSSYAALLGCPRSRRAGVPHGSARLRAGLAQPVSRYMPAAAKTPRRRLAT